MPKKDKKQKPRLNTVKVVLIEIDDQNGTRIATPHDARLHIGELFAGLNLDPAARVKNLRVLQMFCPRLEVEVLVRGKTPKMVPLNRVRLDPDNSVGDHPNLPVIPYGTFFQGSETLLNASAA